MQGCSLSKTGMAMNDYRHIKSLRALHECSRENRKAMLAARSRIAGDAAAVVDSLSPKRLVRELLQQLSPLIELYRLFKGL